MAGIPGVEAGTGSRRLTGSLLAKLLLGLLVVLLTVELVSLTTGGRLPRAAREDVAAARAAALATGPQAAGGKGAVIANEVVAGPRLQTVSGGKATFFVVLDQTVSSEGTHSEPQLVRVGALVTVVERDHKVASVQIL